MSRSRRGYRRSASQRAAGLLALALPAPISRLVDTRIGPFLILVGVPVLIVTGLLRVNFRDGLPTFTLNAERASEIGSQVDWRGNYFQEWGQRARDSYAATQNHAQGIPYGGSATNYGSPYGQGGFPSTDSGYRSQPPYYAQPTYGQQAGFATNPSGYGNAQAAGYGQGVGYGQGAAYGQTPGYQPQTSGGFYGGSSAYRQSPGTYQAYPPQQGPAAGYQTPHAYGGYSNRSSSVDVNRGRY